MTEEVVDLERYLHVVPPELRAVAVLTEPLTIAEKAATQVRHILDRLPWISLHLQEEARRHNTTALVLGAGPVGLLGTMKLMVTGFGKRRRHYSATFTWSTRQQVSQVSPFRRWSFLPQTVYS